MLALKVIFDILAKSGLTRMIMYYTALEIECFIIGFIGGLSALTIAMIGLKQYFTRQYMRYARRRNNMSQDQKIKNHNIHLNIIHKDMGDMRKDIYDLFQEVEVLHHAKD